MARSISLIVYPVQDIDKAKAFYGALLDTSPYTENAYYVGYRVGDQEIGLDPNTTLGPIGYTDVDDIRSMLDTMTQAGAEIIQEPKDVGGGLLIAQVKDANGNVIGFRQRTQ